jgi:hypothetical protein
VFGKPQGEFNGHLCRKNEFSGQIETTYANGKKQTLYGNEYKYQEKFVKHLTLVTEAGINL